MKSRYTLPLLAALCFCAFPLAADDLPEGPGKQILEQSCTGCHDLDRVSGATKTKSGWTDTVSRMVGKGATLDSSEFQVVVDYLVKNFGKADSNIRAVPPSKK